MDKNNIRSKNLILRKAINQKMASDIIVSKILKYKPFIKSKHVLIFYPLKHEINLLKLTEISDKKFYLPKVNGNNLLICPYSTNLKKSDFQVLEPVCEPIQDVSVIDAAFIPCVAIDKNLNRIGYGKGFYDRLFANSDFRAQKIAVLNKELLVDKIKTDKYDKKVDFLITD